MPRERFSSLQALTFEEQRKICISICNFFSPLNARRIRESLDLPVDTPVLEPLTLLDFFTFEQKIRTLDLWPIQQRVRQIIERLKLSGIIKSFGGIDFNERLLFCREMTKRELRGTLWLGEALGLQYIAHEIAKITARLEGRTENGDLHSGSGVLIGPRTILTCAHVVNDMQCERAVLLERYFEIESVTAHQVHDVAVVLLKESAPTLHADLALRTPAITEQLVVAGFPPVPRSLGPVLILQTGEVCGHVQETMDRQPLTLFSTIARPGNSGGPVVGTDGALLGIVTRSLERLAEATDDMKPLPFFAAVPALAIQVALADLLDHVDTLKWEDYD